MNKYSVPYVTLVRSQCQSSTYYRPVLPAVRQAVLRLAWYIRPIRFEDSIRTKKKRFAGLYLNWRFRIFGVRMCVQAQYVYAHECIKTAIERGMHWFGRMDGRAHGKCLSSQFPNIFIRCVCICMTIDRIYCIMNVRISKQLNHQISLISFQHH